jgi:hypothetical protein
MRVKHNENVCCRIGPFLPDGHFGSRFRIRPSQAINLHELQIKFDRMYTKYMLVYVGFGQRSRRINTRIAGPMC